MAAGGDEQIIEKIKSGLTKPCHLPDVKSHISVLQSLSAQEKGEYERKVSNMIEKKEKIEQELQNLKKILFKQACSGLPKELHCLLKESEVLVKEEENYIDLRGERENVGSVTPFTKKGLFVAAIEIGNTYSGFAFSSSSRTEKIQLSSWTNHLLSITDKTPTTILLDSEGNFVAFGYEAEEQYMELVDQQEEHDYYYFQSFRNCIERNLRPTTDTMIKDESGKSFKAQSIFAMSIKFLISKMYDNLRKSIIDITIDDISIILTVPVIWNDSQIEFFKEAATMAGVKQELLAIVLEPIAASFYWHWHQKNTDDTERISSEPNEKEKYLVLDLGGETSTLTALCGTGTNHDELLATAVCPWGGNSVNHEFVIFLHEVFEVEVMEKLKSDNFSDYCDLMKEFERRKYHASFTQNIVYIKIPHALHSAYETITQQTIEKTIVSTKYGKGLGFKNFKLLVSIDIFRVFFKPAEQGILENLSKVLCKTENLEVSTIVMVGGFSECQLIQRAITDAFPRKNVIIPHQPTVSILQGAVLCGHLPLTFDQRVARYTYGIQCCPEFDTNVHPENKKIIVGETAYCKDVFCKYLEIGTKVQVGSKKSRLFRALATELPSLTCELYASTEQNPTFIDDASCLHIGTISVNLPKVRPECLVIEESLIFYETECRIEARDINFQTYEVIFTFHTFQ